MSDYVIVPRKFLDFLRHAPVGSGTCCCGAEMEGHDPYDNHAPCDMWDHNLGGWLKSIKAIDHLASVVAYLEGQCPKTKSNGVRNSDLRALLSSRKEEGDERPYAGMTEAELADQDAHAWGEDDHDDE